MKRLLFVIALCTIMHLRPSLFADSFLQHKDFEFWLYNALQKKLSKKSTFYFETEFRYGAHASDLYLTYLQTGILFTLNKHLEIGPGYRQLYFLNNSMREWKPIYIPLIDLAGKFDWKKWKFVDRNRIQYLCIDGVENLWEYRNRLKINSPWKLGKIGINPWMYEEAFFREKSGFSQNRFAVGAAIPLNKTITSNLFYLRRHLKFLESNKWRYFQSLALYITYSY